MPEKYHPPTLRIVCNIWATAPSTLRWLRFHRDADAAKNIDYLLLRGINADIILLSATCIEGFLVEALKSFMPRQETTGKTFVSRLIEEYYERVHTCTGQEAASRLFRLALGKPLTDIISDKSLLEAVAVLFKFRNGLAHGRSTEYRSYVGENIYDYELEFWGLYKDVEDYLITKKLLKARVTEGGSGWDLLSSEIADHFVALVEPYCRNVVSALPPESMPRMQGALKMAFDEKHGTG